jgi:16S rRNA (uracil1498-N3)-methyltransferase
MRRFFLDPAAIQDGQATITGTEANHIKNVLRLKPRDRICLVNGLGREFEAEIVQISAGEVRVCVVKETLLPIRNKPRFLFAQAMLKDGKMDDLLRQLTEVGIDEWIPFFSRRSIPKPDPSRIAGRYERWGKIVKESVKQCRRTELPRLHEPVTMERIIEIGRSCDLKIIFWENETGAAKESLDPMRGKDCRNILAVVGPEGGFDPDEVKEAQQNGYISLGLGPRILKAETAALAAAVLIQYVFGDMGADLILDK